MYGMWLGAISKKFDIIIEYTAFRISIVLIEKVKYEGLDIKLNGKCLVSTFFS